MLGEAFGPMLRVPITAGFDVRVAAFPTAIDLAVDGDHRDRPGTRGNAYEQLHKRCAPSLKMNSPLSRFYTATANDATSVAKF